MNYDIIITVAVVTAIFVAAITAAKLPKFRYVFRVPEGWAGLLYHNGLFVRRNNAGRHVVWGFGWTLNFIDLRKASPLEPAGIMLPDLNAEQKELVNSIIVLYAERLRFEQDQIRR